VGKPLPECFVTQKLYDMVGQAVYIPNLGKQTIYPKHQPGGATREYHLDYRGKRPALTCGHVRILGDVALLALIQQ
jgi:hypothetical protein